MSNLVFPIPKPPTGSWTYPVKKTPRWKTLIQTPASERGEVRIPLQLTPVYDFEYDFSYLKGDFQTPGSALSNLAGFYERMNGAGDDWLFQDPYDNGATALPVQNGNFEQSSSIPPPGWSAATATLSYDTTTQYEGVRSLIVQAFGSGGAHSINIAVNPGQQVSASCVSKFAGGGSTTAARLQINFYDVNSTLLTFPFQDNTSADWSPNTVDGIAPANTASCVICLLLAGGTSNGQAEFDLVTAQVMTLGPQLIGYGDGTTTQFQIGRTPGSGYFELMQNVFPTALFISGVQVPAGPQPSGNQWYCGLENFLNYSQQFSQSVWITQNASSVTDNSIVAPDGTTTAAAIVFGAGSPAILFQNVLQATLGDTWTFSIYLKASTGTIATHLFLGPINTAGSNVTPGTFIPITLTTAWRRFIITVTNPGLSFAGMQVQVGQSGDLSSKTVHAWGAQLERWTAPTSYVVTVNNAPQRPRGLATFTIAPGNQLAVTADFSYYYRCRFGDDSWTDLEEMLYQIWELKTMKFQSLLL